MRIIIGLFAIALLLSACNQQQGIDEVVDVEITSEISGENPTEDNIESISNQKEDDESKKQANEDVNRPERLEVVIIADILNVRESYNLGSEVIDTVLENDKYIVIDTVEDTLERTWYYVESSEKKYGWIAGWYCIDTTKYKNEFENAYKGMMDDLPFKIGESDEGIVTEYGVPKSEGNFMGGYHFHYDDMTFFTTGGIFGEGYESGEVVVIEYTGDDEKFGLKNGMSIEEVIAILGEPDYRYEHSDDDIEGEWSGTDWMLYYSTGRCEVVLNHADADSPIHAISIKWNKKYFR